MNLSIERMKITYADLASHLALSNNFSDLKKLLQDHEYLAKKSMYLGINSVVDDLKLFQSIGNNEVIDAIKASLLSNRNLLEKCKDDVSFLNTMIAYSMGKSELANLIINFLNQDKYTRILPMVPLPDARHPSIINSYLEMSRMDRRYVDAVSIYTNDKGDRIFAVFAGGIVTLWDVESNEKIFSHVSENWSHETNGWPLPCGNISGDGNLVCFISNGQESFLEVWNVKKRQQVLIVKLPAQYYSYCAFSVSEKFVVVKNFAFICIVNLETGIINQFDIQNNGISIRGIVKLSPVQDIAALYITRDKKLLIFDLQANMVIMEVILDGVQEIQFLSSGSILMISTKQGLYQLDLIASKMQFVSPRIFDTFAISSDNEFIVAVEKDISEKKLISVDKNIKNDFTYNTENIDITPDIEIKFLSEDEFFVFESMKAYRFQKNTLNPIQKYSFNIPELRASLNNFILDKKTNKAWLASIDSIYEADLSVKTQFDPKVYQIKGKVLSENFLISDKEISSELNELIEYWQEDKKIITQSVEEMEILYTKTSANIIVLYHLPSKQIILAKDGESYRLGVSDNIKDLSVLVNIQNDILALFSKSNVSLFSLKPVRVIKNFESFGGLSFGSNGQNLYLLKQSRIFVYDIKADKFIDQIETLPHDEEGKSYGFIKRVKYFSEVDRFATVSQSHLGTHHSSYWDCIIRIWDGDLKELDRLEGHTAWVMDFEANPQNTFMVSSGWDNSIFVWDLINLDYKSSVYLNTHLVSFLFHSDGRSFLAKTDVKNNTHLQKESDLFFFTLEPGI